jgi:DnaK suppressor protein
MVGTKPIGCAINLNFAKLIEGKSGGNESMPKKIRQDKLRKIIQERKKKILADLQQEVDKLGTDYRQEYDRGMDSGDASLVDLLQSVGIKMVDIRQEELIKLDQAERKLNSGTYGTCEECGTEISEERLAAMPYAVRCIRCEERFEETDVQGRGPTL